MDYLEKPIIFLGDELLTFLEKETNKFYISIKHICFSLGMSKGQYDHQIQKVKNDAALKGACKFKPLETRGGIQNILMLELEYLTIWLVKINPGRFEEKLKKKLIKYQLYCKEVLSDVLFGKRENLDNKGFENNSLLREVNERTSEVYQIDEEIKELLIRKINECELMIWRIEYLKRNAESIYKNCLYEKIEIDGREIDFKEVNEIGKERLLQIKKSLENI